MAIIVFASGLPPTTQGQESGLILKYQELGAVGESGREVRNSRSVSAFGEVSIC